MSTQIEVTVNWAGANGRISGSVEQGLPVADVLNALAGLNNIDPANIQVTINGTVVSPSSPVTENGSRITAAPKNVAMG